MATIQAAEQLVFAIDETRMELVEFLANSNAAHLRAIPATRNQIEVWLAETEKLVDDDDEIALARKIRAGYRNFDAQWRKLPLDAPPAELRPAVARLNDDLAANDLLAQPGNCSPWRKGLSTGAATATRTWPTASPSVSRCSAICGAVAGLVAGFGIARGITHSIVNLYVPVRPAGGWRR